MAASDFLRNLRESARKARLSRLVFVLFAVALVLPWAAFAWLTVVSRGEQLNEQRQVLEGLARAYAEHAARLHSESHDGSGEDVAAFGRALGLPHITLWLSPIRGAETRLTPANTITAAVERADAGFVAHAAMETDAALRDWANRTRLEAFGLVLRTLLVAIVGALLVQQLRWREQLQAELACAREKAETASRAKSDFLANMSHELRTPLNAILGFSEMIKTGMMGPLNRRYREYGGDILSSGKHLLQLINEILDLSKLEAGRFKLQEETVDLPVLIDSCLHLLHAQAERSKIALGWRTAKEPALIRADERRLRQILINLLSNAVKFTPEGGRVEISVARTEDGLVIAVSDSGIGMAPEHIAKALEPFGQIENALGRKHEGTGLGLPLAKGLIELHGGKMAIASTVGRGTTITITLPPGRLLADEHRLVLVAARA